LRANSGERPNAGSPLSGAALHPSVGGTHAQVVAEAAQETHGAPRVAAQHVSLGFRVKMRRSEEQMSIKKVGGFFLT